MPTAVKERILNLITDAHQKYFEITQFFLDPSGFVAQRFEMQSAPN